MTENVPVARGALVAGSYRHSMPNNRSFRYVPSGAKANWMRAQPRMAQAWQPSSSR